MAPGRKRNGKAIPIGEHIRITVDLKLREFMNAHDQVELEFPNCLSAVERAFVHNLVKKYGLKSKSKGKGEDRFLTIYKRDGSTIVQADAELTLSKQSFQAIQHFLSTYTLTPKEKSDVLPITQKMMICNKKSHKDFKNNTGRLNDGVPLVPVISSNPELESFRKTLPVSMYKSEIMNLLKDNQVIMISGETGSGKTTQIPQFILDEASLQKQKCRIICTQPRRLSAISICERVAHERNVRVGENVGYQIRLESRVSPRTGLIYCTTGVLLRTLMGCGNSIANITHIIIDEIHERDKFSDYLLIVLRDYLPKYPNLKLILMSATIDTNIFTNYFQKCPMIKIPGRLFPVQSYFLEDVLRMTNYSNRDMKKFSSLLKNKQDQQQMQEHLMRSFRNTSINYEAENDALNTSSDKIDISNDLKELMDNSLQGFWLSASTDDFAQILHLILNENVSVNYQHSSIGCTILMLTAGRGLAEHTEHILNLGADVKLRSCNNWTAYDWAIQSDQTECAQLILAYTNTNVESVSKQSYDLEHQRSSQEDKELLEAYSHSFNADEEIDHDLILHIILSIHCSKSEGGILVFLPGYEDIINLRDMVLKDAKMQERPYQLFILHSNMHTIDHKQVFDKLNGIRKIILSTNIAQTSITINDVVYVIDSGKVKELSFDGVSGTTCLRSNWISRACAMQRAGRAGRVQPGECFHLFSKIRYTEMMQKFTTPDILRTPLQELCLQTKLLAPVNMPIADFLGKAVEPPPSIVTKQAVQLLKTMGALDEFEDLTEMGIHLVDIPLDPKLAKMLIYSVTLKCLDPVLTIVSSLAHKDPFIIPSQPFDKRTLTACRKQFSADTFSDHMVFLRVFQEWQKARQAKYERQFCVKNFLNSATMEQIVNTRLQLLGQLRASGFVKARGHYDVKDLNENSDNWAVVKAAITASLYPTLCRIDKAFMTLRTQNENKVLFHPSSTLKCGSNPYKNKPSTSMLESLKSAPSEWMVYEEKSRIGPWCYIKTITMVTPITVALFAGPIRAPESMVSKAPPIQLSSDSESDSEQPQQVATKNTKTDIFSVDDWAIFRSESPISDFVFDLRRKWNALFISRMSNPSQVMTPTDETVLQTIVKVLTQEEMKAGFVQPTGIGQRPRALTTEDMSPTIFQNFTRRKMTNAGYNAADDHNHQQNWRQQNNFKKNVTSSESKKKYFIFKLTEGSSGRYSHKSDFRVADEIAISFRKILQNGGQVYLIFLSRNRPNFEGVAQVIDKNRSSNNFGGPSKGQTVQLNWLSRLSVPVSASGVGASINVSGAYDGLELEDDYGKALIDYLINYKPLFYKSNH